MSLFKHSLRFFSTHYETLGIPSTSTLQEIRLVYLSKVKLHHPDRNPHKTSEIIFKQVQNSYEILKNPQKRMEYDDFLSKSKSDTIYSEKTENPYNSRSYEDFMGRKKRAYDFKNYQNYYNRKKQKAYSKYEEKENQKTDFFLNKVFLIAFCGFGVLFLILDQVFFKKDRERAINLMKLAERQKNDDPFMNEFIMPNVNPEFERFTGVSFDRRINKDAEAIRIELIQKELNNKNVKIEVGSNEIYKKKTKINKNQLENMENKKKGVFKSGSNNENQKGKLLTVKEYRDRFV